MYNNITIEAIAREISAFLVKSFLTILLITDMSDFIFNSFKAFFTSFTSFSLNDLS